MLRDEDDLQLLAELGGVLDQTVTAAGLSSGAYLVLRELVATPGPHPVTELAEGFGTDPEQIAEVCKRLVSAGFAATQGSGVAVTDAGLEAAAAVETEANEAMRAYVVERPHTATVYGLVASMQSGRFTVEDLLAFLAEGPTDDDA
ncbi:MAG: MarR family transcriptional regulator [Thermoleophilia bacterium]|jgi:DNA-binding MarR family transcriptional regulator|nr:MarR family transcriptional regulator [Thermoleophilia bacterium]